MARQKRTLAQVEQEDEHIERQKAEGHAVEETGNDEQLEISGRPKRIRKQTQKYASAPTTAATANQKRASKKATTGTTKKGKGKATTNLEETGLNLDDEEIGKELSSEPPKKKARRKKEPKESQELKEVFTPPTMEKRLAQFRSQCPQATWERAERVRQQRFFMIDRKREGKELKEEFKVLGSTGNVYTVTVDRSLRCNCPDNRRGNHCKHIMFILLKVLCVPMTSHIWYQKALLTSELETVFSQAPIAPNSVTNPRVREAFLRATGQIAESSIAATNSKKRIPGEEDDCPICYDTMFEVAEAQLTFCEECGNALHKECFSEYEKSARKGGRDVTCVWCRSDWGVAPAAKPASSAARRGGFVNLAGVVPDIDGHRDTSTYYHGPVRGEHYYGYRVYGDI